MNMLRTDRTYKTAKNAEKALERAAATMGLDVARLRYVIAVAADGRYAPVVLMGGSGLATSPTGAATSLIAFAHLGVTVAN